MRIAIRLSFALVVGAICFGGTPVFAETTAIQPIMPLTVSQTGSGNPVSSAPVQGLPPLSSVSSSSGSSAGIVVPTEASEKSSERASEKESGQSKVPDSVRGVIKKLSGSSGDVTLEDLNNAREAMAKLDVLIDIEKRLTDLAELRQEREQKMNGGSSNSKNDGGLSAIAASSLLPRQVASAPVPVQPIVMPVVPVVPMAASAAAPSEPVIVLAKVSVERIYGAAGHYAAQVKVNDGVASTVTVGEKLSDGSVVKAITNTGIVLVSGKKERTVSVKNITTVFSGR